MAASPGSKALLRLFLVLGALAIFGVLFLQSVRTSQSEPYVVPAADLTGWTVTRHPNATGTAPVLQLTPPDDAAKRLFQQIFRRAMESLAQPPASGVPLLLKSEFDQAFAGRATLDALQAIATSSGLDRARVTPDCILYKRASEPGVTRQLWVAAFHVEGFARFRQALVALLDGQTGTFDPDALSPVLFAASTDTDTSRWLPMRIAPADCLAPLEIE